MVLPTSCRDGLGKPSRSFAKMHVGCIGANDFLMPKDCLPACAIIRFSFFLVQFGWVGDSANEVMETVLVGKTSARLPSLDREDL